MSREGDLDYSLGPALDVLRRLSALNHAMERLSSRMERELGVTAQQRLVLRCVGKYPGLTVGQLAGLLCLDPGTVSASVTRLAARNFVERRRDPRDARRVALGLTAAGRELERPTVGTVERSVEQLLTEVDAESLTTTKAVLAKLEGLLLAAADESAGPLGARRGRRRQ